MPSSPANHPPQNTDRRNIRRAALPVPTFDGSLPVAARRQEIADAIAGHQVVVLCGQTGSGKTTQIPKICLTLGRGIDGMIGQTQPRRIAARATAARIAEELGQTTGRAVGYKIRFSDQTRPDTCIKVMTDGMLLAETQHDRLLRAYDTIIIDEAHERSLNIDLLIGYIKSILPRRPDLKVILTSATIDPQRFSDFFDGAPILQVEGRAYPVDVWYRPAGYEVNQSQQADESPGESTKKNKRPGGKPRRASIVGDLGTHDPVRAVVRAVDEIADLTTTGDMLVFLSGEREIRETAKALRHHHPRGTQILPLFARLSAKEQHRVFEPHSNRRIILATNVAETSLTVPDIEFVIDTGLARISRYSGRSKVQRLPIESISQASADQRAGRCGRLGPGVCVRLYSHEDFDNRPEFPQPEILRSHLASVILHMKSLGLGDVAQFEFLDRPSNRMIKDGYETLTELGAVDNEQRLTDIGRRLARLPIDPRLGRMILQADREDCMREILIIASALAVPDPRQRPMETADAADAAHREFQTDDSDFLAYLKLWKSYHESAKHLSRNQLSKWCAARHLSYMRMRDWHDIHTQLKTLARESGLRFNQREAGYEAIHRSILAGLLSRIGRHREKAEFNGAQQITFHIHPGSPLRSTPPPWIVAGELVETSRLFARCVAKVDPAWIETLAASMAKHSYSNVRWNEKTGHTIADERVQLFGLTLVEARRRSYEKIDPVEARRVFLLEGLVEGRTPWQPDFLAHNRSVQAQVESLQAKQRTRAMAVSPDEIAQWYDQRLPRHVCSVPSLKRWLARATPQSKSQLMLTTQDLLRDEADLDAHAWFPDSMTVQRLEIPLQYQHEPGRTDDGLTATVPIEAIGALNEAAFSWLVPGLLEDKIRALIKSLPKGLRTNFLPVAQTAARCATALGALDEKVRRETSIEEALAGELTRLCGIAIRADAFERDRLPEHLAMNFQVVDAKGKPVAHGRNLAALKTKLRDHARASLGSAASASHTRTGLRQWDFGDLAPTITLESHLGSVPAFPALLDAGDSVTLTLADSQSQAEMQTRCGLRRLFAIAAKDEIAYQLKRSGDLMPVTLTYTSLGSGSQLRDQLALFIAGRVFVDDQPIIRNAKDFDNRLNANWDRIQSSAVEAFELARTILNAGQRALCALDNATTPAAQTIATEEREHIDTLVSPFFLTQTPLKWLSQLPRYLAAVMKRIERAGRDKNTQSAQIIDGYRRLYEQQRQRNDEAQVANPELELFRWMIEELRISLFAQEMGTILPISTARMDKQWTKTLSWTPPV